VARPKKIGLDYFPLDVVIDDDVELIEAEFGLQGFAILIKLWQKIYRNGYYIEWSTDNELLFSKRLNVEKTLVSTVVNGCFHRKLFNKEIYKQYGILTSKGIQKRYILATSQCNRTAISFVKEYILVDKKHRELITEETPVNSEFSTQSIEEEKRGEETKEEDNTGDAIIPPTKIPKPPKEPKYKEDSPYYQMAFYLRGKILEINPKTNVPKDTPKGLEKWADKIRIMCEQDKRTLEDTAKVIDFAFGNKFWFKVILSPTALRNNFDKMGADVFKVSSAERTMRNLEEWANKETKGSVFDRD